MIDAMSSCGTSCRSPGWFGTAAIEGIVLQNSLLRHFAIFLKGLQFVRAPIACRSTAVELIRSRRKRCARRAILMQSEGGVGNVQSFIYGYEAVGFTSA